MFRYYIASLFSSLNLTKNISTHTVSHRSEYTPHIFVVKHGGGSVMVWGCMSAAGTRELQFIEGTMNAIMYCDILKQSMIPSLRRLGRRAVFQHDNDHCLAKEAEGKGDGLAKHVFRPKPYRPFSQDSDDTLNGHQHIFFMYFKFSFKSPFVVLHYLCIKLQNKIFILMWVCFLCSFYGKFASLLFWLPLSVSIVFFYWKSCKHYRRNCIELFKQNGNTKKYICGTLPFTALQVNRNYDDFRWNPEI